jgi:hypothetical protein
MLSLVASPKAIFEVAIVGNPVPDFIKSMDARRNHPGMTFGFAKTSSLSIVSFKTELLTRYAA